MDQFLPWTAAYSLRSQCIVLKPAWQLKVPVKCVQKNKLGPEAPADRLRLESSLQDQGQALLQDNPKPQCMLCRERPVSGNEFPLDLKVPFASESLSPYVGALRSSDCLGQKRGLCAETRVLHYSLATQMLKRTKKGCWPHHSVRCECGVYGSKTAGETETGGARALSLPRGRGPGIFLTYPTCKEESVSITDDSSSALFFFCVLFSLHSCIILAALIVAVIKEPTKIA